MIDWMGLVTTGLAILQATAAPQVPPAGGPAPADGPAPFVNRRERDTTARTDARHCNPPGMQRGTSYGVQWRVARTYTAEMWFSKNADGVACLATFGDHGMQIDWDIKTYGFLHEVGQYDLTIPPDAIAGDPKAVFRLSKALFAGSGGYTGLYGWFGKAGTADTVEFYVNEMWGGLPIDMSDCVAMGSIEVDGGTYDIYTRPRRGKRGEQWWSNRRTPRMAGTISYARHMAGWRKLGMTPLPLTRVSLGLEAHWGSPTSGSVRYDYFTIDRPTSVPGGKALAAPHG